MESKNFARSGEIPEKFHLFSVQDSVRSPDDYLITCLQNNQYQYGIQYSLQGNVHGRIQCLCTALANPQ
jgi:hypothetical protein